MTYLRRRVDRKGKRFLSSVQMMQMQLVDIEIQILHYIK